jgi:hypothetical protein
VSLLRTAILVVFFALALAFVWWGSRRQASSACRPTSNLSSSVAGSDAGKSLPPSVDGTPTHINARNLLLRKGPRFRIYISWLRGDLVRTRAGVSPSFDNPDSFILGIKKGIIRVNLGDIGNFLNTTAFPLKNVLVRGEGKEVKLTGTLHKFHLSLPVELFSSVSATEDGRIRLHVNRINVLKMPLARLLGGLNVEIYDIVGKATIPGVEVSKNDILLNTTQLVPPPHILGQLTNLSVDAPDLVLIYGNGHKDETQNAPWHNFLRFEGGTLDFGKLSMHPVDLTLIDASNDPWFNLDLVNYHAQLINGHSRMTPQQGLEIYMPDLDVLSPKTQGEKSTDPGLHQNPSPDSMVSSAR